VSAIDWVGGDDNEDFRVLVRLYDNFPRAPPQRGFGNPSAWRNVRTNALRIEQHTAEVDLGEAPVDHSP